MIEIYVRPSNNRWDYKWVSEVTVVAWIIDTENSRKCYGIRKNRHKIMYKDYSMPNPTLQDLEFYDIGTLSKVRATILQRLGTEWVTLTVRSRWIGYINPVTLVQWKKQKQ